MKKAIILMNLGTPAEPTKASVRAFLKEFLWDPRVVEVPRPIWWLVLNLIILSFRTPKVVKNYQKIWLPEGSPLRVITQAQVDKLRQKLFTDSKREGSQGDNDSELIVDYAMTYSGPSLAEKVEELNAEGIEHILVLPLYPQYSATTTGSIYDQLGVLARSQRDISQVHIIKHYFDHPLYIEALANSIKEQWEKTGQPDRLLFSFHSIPQSYADAGDPYYKQCLATAEAVADYLKLPVDSWQVSFQSRIGFAKWLSPYTDETLQQWAQQGVKHADVICPAFSVDCLETLEEIGMENRELFLSQGGEVFNLIACLNDRDDHVAMMAKVVQQYLPEG